MIDTAPRLPDRFTEPIERAAEARGEVKGLLTVLEARRLPLSTDQRELIESCTDTDTLLTWMRKAVAAASVDEVLAD